MFILIAQISELVRTSVTASMHEYDRLQKLRQAPSVDKLVVVVTAATKHFDPKHDKQSVLTPALRAKLAEALAHVGYNIAAINAKAPTA